MMGERIEAFETKFMKRMLMISCKEKKTSDFVQEEIKNNLARNLDNLLSTIEIKKLKWHGFEIFSSFMDTFTDIALRRSVRLFQFI